MFRCKLELVKNESSSYGSSPLRDPGKYTNPNPGISDRTYRMMWWAAQSLIFSFGVDLF